MPISLACFPTYFFSHFYVVFSSTIFAIYFFLGLNIFEKSSALYMNGTFTSNFLRFFFLYILEKKASVSITPQYWLLTLKWTIVRLRTLILQRSLSKIFSRNICLMWMRTMKEDMRTGEGVEELWLEFFQMKETKLNIENASICFPPTPPPPPPHPISVYPQYICLLFGISDLNIWLLNTLDIHNYYQLARSLYKFCYPST